MTDPKYLDVDKARYQRSRETVQYAVRYSRRELFYRVELRLRWWLTWTWAQGKGL